MSEGLIGRGGSTRGRESERLEGLEGPLQSKREGESARFIGSAHSVECEASERRLAKVWWRARLKRLNSVF